MDSFLHDYFAFLRFASISTDPAYRGEVIRCAQWLVEKMNSWGLDTALHKTAGHPVVLGYGPQKPGRPTVLLYGHYDVQPVDPLEKWASDPFEPVIRDGLVFARGAADNKGQILAHLFGLRQTLTEKGDLPVNVIVVIEGEEEIGSPNLPAFLSEHVEDLACDVVVVSDTSMIAPDFPTLAYGLRGLVGLEVKVTGPARDLHSGDFGGILDNPVTTLARLVGGLHDSNRKVTIPGFYDGVQNAEAWELKEWKRLAQHQQTLCEEAGVSHFVGEPGYNIWEQVWTRPSAEVNGFGGGYQGIGTKTVLPSEAFAKLTFRLVPGQDPKRILHLVERYFRENAPLTVKVETQVTHCSGAYLADPHFNYGQAAQTALGKLFTKKPALIRVGGSIPIVADFKSILNAETLLIGLSLDNCHAHGANENFPVKHLALGARLNGLLLEEISKINRLPAQGFSEITEEELVAV